MNATGRAAGILARALQAGVTKTALSMIADIMAAGNDGPTIGYGAMARSMGISRRYAVTCIRSIETAGIITVDRSTTFNNYHIA